MNHGSRDDEHFAKMGRPDADGFLIGVGNPFDEARRIPPGAIVFLLAEKDEPDLEIKAMIGQNDCTLSIVSRSGLKAGRTDLATSAGPTDWLCTVQCSKQPRGRLSVGLLEPHRDNVAERPNLFCGISWDANSKQFKFTDYKGTIWHSYTGRGWSDGKGRGMIWRDDRWCEVEL